MLSELRTDDVQVVFVSDLGQHDFLGALSSFDFPSAWTSDLLFQKVQKSGCKIDADVAVPHSHPSVLDKVWNVQGLPLLKALQMSILAAKPHHDFWDSQKK